jgi:hypothetical protein
LSIFQLFY